MRKSEKWDRITIELAGHSRVLAKRYGMPYGRDAFKPGFEAFLRMLFEREAACRGDAAEAARAFVSSGRWPDQDAWPAHFNFLRLLCAAESAAQMGASDYSGFVPGCPLSTRREAVLTWLLIDRWERCFDVWLKLHAVSLFFSLPLYGLTPAGE